ncbi:hypothetical protein KIPB_005754 [Kipferlia bialata]|uniref:Kelch-type beta propeller n=1 Tax=Kipferlia bialata TaxID=797122 RepID=A0A9K3CXV5_9EUKA|nr:hypothetical protein KIPB_005754 [Kipferlia bialata]|eukprot:g5754.t1
MTEIIASPVSVENDSATVKVTPLTVPGLYMKPYSRCVRISPNQVFLMGIGAGAPRPRNRRAARVQHEKPVCMIATIAEDGTVSTAPVPSDLPRESEAVCLGGKVYVYSISDDDDSTRFVELSLDTLEWKDITGKDCPQHTYYYDSIPSTPRLVGVSDTELLLLSCPRSDDSCQVHDIIKTWVYDCVGNTWERCADGPRTPDLSDDCDQWDYSAAMVGSRVHVVSSVFGGGSNSSHCAFSLPSSGCPGGHWDRMTLAGDSLCGHLQSLGSGLGLSFHQTFVDCYDAVRHTWSPVLGDLDREGRTKDCQDFCYLDGYATFTSCALDAETVFVACSSHHWWVEQSDKLVTGAYLVTVDRDAAREMCTTVPDQVTEVYERSDEDE